MKRSSSPVRGVVLAGGFGTRLRSVTGSKPKVLVNIGGRPLLEWVLRWLEGEGCREVVLCLGYRAEAIREFVRGLSSHLKFFFSVEPEPLGTAGALKWALPLLEDRVLVVNGDTIFDTSLAPLVEFHCRHRPLATMALAHVPDAGRFGAVECDEEQRVRHFGEKQLSETAGWVNAGIYLMESRLIDELVPRGKSSLEQDIFPRMAKQDNPFYAVPLPGQLLDVGTPEGYQVALQALSHRTSQFLSGRS